MTRIRNALLAGASLAAIGLLGLGSPSTAQAAFINDIGDDFTVTFNLPAGVDDNDGGAPPAPLTATAAFDVTSVTAGSLTLAVTLTNTTALGTFTNAGITSFGIGVSPDATGVTFANVGGVVFTSAELQGGQQNFPGGFKQIDVCVFTQGCSGGGQGSALAAGGTSDTFILTITGNFAAGVTLDPFPVKFQTSAGSFEFGGTPGTSVPEPASLALLGAGLLGLGLARRARRKA